jgi:hypothetical protein
MSRGYGRIERAILEIMQARLTLEDGSSMPAGHLGFDAFELTARVFEREPNRFNGARIITPAELVSVRRALAKLRKKEPAIGFYREHGDRRGIWGWWPSADPAPRPSTPQWTPVIVQGGKT